MLLRIKATGTIINVNEAVAEMFTASDAYERVTAKKTAPAVPETQAAEEPKPVTRTRKKASK